MRFTFSSSTTEYMTYDYYLKKTKSMCEIRLNQL